jgi:hypothetical protein
LLSDRRDDDARTSPLDQLSTKPLFQSLELLAQRWLSCICPLRSAPEMQCIRESDEVFELPQIRHGISCSERLRRGYGVPLAFLQVIDKIDRLSGKLHLAFARFVGHLSECRR